MIGKRRRQPHLTRAINTAKRVLTEIGVEHPMEADIETLAYARRVLVRENGSTGARATLVRVGDRGIVGVAGSLALPQRRFAVAHELGHFELHPAHSYAALCHDKDLRESYRRDGREAEANAFAAEFLMPERLVGRMCDVDDVNWGVVREIATGFQVSLTAAALRFAALCPESVAVVWSQDGCVLWNKRGPTFRHWIKPGRKLDSFSLAYDFFKSGAVEEAPEPVPVQAWVDSNDEGDLIEHSIALPRYRSVFTLLWEREAE